MIPYYCTRISRGRGNTQAGQTNNYCTEKYIASYYFNSSERVLTVCNCIGFSTPCCWSLYCLEFRRTRPNINALFVGLHFECMALETFSIYMIVIISTFFFQQTLPFLVLISHNTRLCGNFNKCVIPCNDMKL